VRLSVVIVGYQHDDVANCWDVMDVSTAAEHAPLVDRSVVSVRAAAGRTKLVTMPIDGGPVAMGMRDGVAEHYEVPAGDFEPHATTLDYVVGATAACLTGTFGGLLERLGQPTSDGALVATAVGEIVNDHGVLRIASVEVRYALVHDPEIALDEVWRAHERHVKHCPIAHTIGNCVEIRTSLEVSDPVR
jgi:uncharacterized OsmC-like protein